MDYFYWHLDYDAQKPAFEKLPPNNDAIYLQHKHKSFSVCFLTGYLIVKKDCQLQQYTFGNF